MIAWSSLVTSVSAWMETRWQLPLLGWDTITLAAVSTALSFYLATRDRSGLPGPVALPILGNIPGILLSGSIDTYLDKMRENYGDVFEITLGGGKKVIINGYDLTHHLLVNNAKITSSRKPAFASSEFKKLATDSPGIIWQDYPQVREQRNFALRTLKDRGMGKHELEPLIQEEIREFLDKISKDENRPFDFAPLIHFAVTNIIVSIVFGQRYDYGNEEFASLVKTLTESVQANIRVTSTRNIPFITWLPGDVSGRKRGRRASENLRNFMKDAVQEHKHRLDRENPVDFIDQYLVKIEEEKGDRNTTFTEGNLISEMLQLFAAGSDTTSTTLRWAVLLMAQNPDVQVKIHQEIDTVVGAQPSSVTQSLPFVDATIKEVQRIGNIVPMALPHKLDEDLEVNGYHLKKDMDLTFNLSSILNDPETFPNPTKFDPERFLGDLGRVRTQRMIPFGIGKRRCLGESLANMELKLFFTALMQKYRISAPPGVKLNPDIITSVIRGPNSYKVIFTPRIIT